MKKSITLAAAASMLLSATSSTAAVPPADACEAAKNKIAGTYYSCREKAEATAIKKATSANYGKCTEKFNDKWGDAETADCPDMVTTASMNAYLAAQASEAASVIGGAPIPACSSDLATCQGDLSTCQADLSTADGDLSTCQADLSTAEGDLSTCGGDLGTCEGDLSTCQADLAACGSGVIPATGQTTCYNTLGNTISCVGTGQDGEIQAGMALAYLDNGDGTVTDLRTDLMWEKKSDDDGIHEKDQAYTWDDAFGVFLATLNSGGGFAGHADWRLPNIKELITIANYGEDDPCVSSVFNNGACQDMGSSTSTGCSVLNCSCTKPSIYWTSTSRVGLPTQAYYVSFNEGGVVASPKNPMSTTGYVRAVRGGL